MEIEGAVCIITGASSGIGAATGRLLNEMGANVVLAGRRADRLERLSSELPGSLSITTDVTDRGQLERLVGSTLNAYGTIDVLVNNAGQGLHVPLDLLDPIDLRAVFELNVIAPLVGSQLVLPAMRAQSHGAIVNVSSATTLRLVPGLGGYSATKAALNMIAQIGRLEWSASGVTVSTVYPTVTATEFFDKLRAGQRANRSGESRTDSPELVASSIAFAILSGEAHVLVGDPPRSLKSGDRETFGALLAEGTRRP